VFGCQVKIVNKHQWFIFSKNKMSDSTNISPSGGIELQLAVAGILIFVALASFELLRDRYKWALCPKAFQVSFSPPFSWIYKTLKWPIVMISHDAITFLSTLSFLTWYFMVLSLIWLWSMTAYFIMSPNPTFFISAPHFEGYFWIPALFSFIGNLVALFGIWRLVKHYKVYLPSELPSRTVMVSGIPYNTTYEIEKEILTWTSENYVESICVDRDTSPGLDLIQENDRLVEEMEFLLFSIDHNELQGKNLLLYDTKIQETNRQIKKITSEIDNIRRLYPNGCRLKDKFSWNQIDQKCPPTGICFVTFKNVEKAKSFLSQKNRYFICPAPDPRDIIFENLGVRGSYLKRVIVWVLGLALMIFYLFPTIGIIKLMDSNFVNIIPNYLQCSGVFCWKEILRNLLPTILVYIFMLILKPILQVVLSLERKDTQSRKIKSLMNKL
jgi:hypothetical protein